MSRVTGVVIGASKDAIHTIKKARQQGIYVIALDGNPDAEGFKHADESVNVNISDMDAVCNAIEKIKPDFVIPVPIGRYLLTTGYVNERYNLKGIKYQATELSTDKYLFHQELNKNGLRQIQAYLVNKEVSVDDIKIKYPAIMKPRFGSGSRDVFYIESDEELKESYQKAIECNEDFILEQAACGTEYSVDGAVMDGELKITLLRKKIITPLPIRQPISSFSVVKTEENTKLIDRVYKHLKNVVKALNYDNCLLNADLIINDDEVFVIEIAPRPSGHNLHNVFVPLATGIDIAEEYIKYLLDKPSKFETDIVRRIQIRFFDFEDVTINKIPTEKELKESGKCRLILWNCNINQGEKMNKVVNGHSIMDRGFFVIEGDSEEDLQNQSTWVLSQFGYERTK